MRHPRRRSAIAALAVLTAAASLWAGRMGVVTLRNGDAHEGDVTERDGQVIVRRNGVDSVFEKDAVGSIDFTTYEDRFDEAIAKLAGDDVAGRVALAREAYDRRAYALALGALQSALEIEPMNREARQLQTLVSSQVQLESGRPTTSKSTQAAGPRVESDRVTRRVRGLSEEQINRVRQVELRRDEQVRIQFRDNVRKRFVDTQPGLDFRSFNTRNDVAQAFAILEKGTPEMQEDVAITSEPAAIAIFGRKLQVAVVQGCATSSCHGGEGAGAFRLLGGVPEPAMTATNFYLLNAYVQKLQSDGGVFSAEVAPMIDRGNARRSLLFQYALPRARATLRHPQVRNWDGLFRDENDPLARDLIAWMDGDLARLQTPYGFDFRLPSRPAPSTASAATQAATLPAVQPTPTR